MRPGYVDPIEDVTAMQGELSDELALRSSIPVAEGVDGVQFPHVVRGAVAELLDVELHLEVVSKQRRKVRVVGKTPRGADLIRALAG